MTVFRLLRAQRLCLLTLLVLASGCSTQSRPPLPEELRAMQGNIALINWQLSGKLGIRNQQQTKSAYLNWQQCGEVFDIRVSGPLGQGGARLQGSAEIVTLQTAQKTSSASNPEQLLQQQLGWSMPISQLHYWIRGIPSPDQGYRNNPDNNGFEQAGWHISYLQLQQVEGLTLPVKAIATHPRLKLTLLLKNWQLDPDCSETP